MRKIIGVFACALIFTGCYYDKADQLYPSPTTTCDTTTVTFAKDILPIMNTKCATAGCHDNQTKQNGYDMGTYEGVKMVVDDGKLIGVTRQDAGYLPMPQGMAKLDECSINKIVRWVHLGAQNN